MGCKSAHDQACIEEHRNLIETLEVPGSCCPTSINSDQTEGQLQMGVDPDEAVHTILNSSPMERMVCNPLFDAKAKTVTASETHEMKMCPMLTYAACNSAFSSSPNNTSLSFNDDGRLESSVGTACNLTESEFQDDADEIAYRQLQQLEVIEEQLFQQQGAGELHPAFESDSNTENLSGNLSDIPSNVSKDCLLSASCLHLAATGCSDGVHQNKSPGASHHDAALPWNAISQKLLQLGFSSLSSASGQLDADAAYSVIQSVVGEYERQINHVQQLADAVKHTSSREEQLVKQFQIAQRYVLISCGCQN